MKEFLKKIKVVDNLTTKIEIQKKDFVPKFRAHVDEGSTSVFSGMFEVFSSSKNDFKGQVGFDYFEIRRKQRMFQSKMGSAIASGTYRQEGQHLVIETEINGFSKMMIPFYVFLIVVYPIFIFGFFQDGFKGDNTFALPFIIFHALFMFSIPYIGMRLSTKRMKRDLEREFYFIARK